MKMVPACAVAFLLSGVAPALASDDAPPPLDHGIQVSASAGSSASVSISHPAFDGSQARITITEDAVLAEVGERSIALHNTELPVELWRNQHSILLLDINFDGFLDVGVLDSVGYGGVNMYWRFSLADPKAGFAYADIFSNPERDDVMGWLRSSARSGPIWSSDIYRIEDGEPVFHYSRERHGEYDRIIVPGMEQVAIISAIAPDPWDFEATDDPAFHQTALATVPRAYFHNDPDEQSRRDAYLVDGDVGRVLNVTFNRDWLYVTFTHSQTGRTTEGWLRAEDMVFVQG